MILAKIKISIFFVYLFLIDSSLYIEAPKKGNMFLFTNYAEWRQQPPSYTTTMNDTEFEHMALRLRPRLRTVAERTAKSTGLTDADAEDAVQEALLRLWRMGDRLDTYNSIESLAATIVRNVCIDMSRHPAPPTSTIEGLNVAADSSADSSLTAESERGAVERLIDGLPATQQRLLRMRGEGMSLDEIAVAAAMPKSSVKALISKARRQLLERMKNK